nr:hypothetical protein Iba_scaffold30022CG0070 [Ipomoea batatas]GMC80702.1 hypothetical protein Iba_chr04aCG22840 [Ipomoea batatas]
MKPKGTRQKHKTSRRYVQIFKKNRPFVYISNDMLISLPINILFASSFSLAAAILLSFAACANVEGCDRAAASLKSLLISAFSRTSSADMVALCKNSC